MKMKAISIFQYESLVHATAGAAGSIVAMCSLYPLDNVKIRLQMEDLELKKCTTFQALIHIYTKEGINGLYRGLQPVITSIAVSNFIYFYTFHGIKTMIPPANNSSKTDLGVAIAAGVVNVLLTSPLWVVNSRLKLSDQLPYCGLFEGLINISRTEGILSLWNGLLPSLMLVSNPAIHFTVYEALKRRFPVKSAWGYFLIGAIAKTMSTIVTYPLQLAQAKQRINDVSIGSFRMLKNILMKSGIRGLYQGLEVKLWQTVFTAALMFMTYEKIAYFVFRILLRKR